MSPAETRAPFIPCFIAWLVPGAGHLMLGRVTQALVFAAVVGLTFFTGLALEGTVYAFDREQPLSYLATLADLGVGPLDLWARADTYGSLRFRVPDSQVDPVTRAKILRRLRQRVSAQTHTYGRTFLLTAGLMNLLLVLDVYDYCIGRKGALLRPEAGPQDTAPAQGGG
ncbi:MAG: DUF6677 family protein [Acidobacteriota bacterium]